MSQSREFNPWNVTVICLTILICAAGLADTAEHWINHAYPPAPTVVQWTCDVPVGEVVGRCHQ